MQPTRVGYFGELEDHQKNEELDKGSAIHMDGEDAVVHIEILFVPEV
jgi:hypothetical protein